MRTITNDFKTELKTMGKEIDAKIIYTIDGTTYTLGADDLNSVKPHYESGILKSTMKQLDIDSNIDIPLGTIIECKFGVKVNGSFEYISYGHYVVYSSEKQEDLYSYKITCYDKMLYSMVDYESFATYPITIREYLDALCTQIGLTFKNANDTFTNYDRIIANELYLDENGNTLGYKFRDVLDELAQVTASTICINENDDEVEIRYITNAGEETTNVSGTNLSIESEDTQVNKIELVGNTTQASIPTPSSPQEVVNVTGRQEIKAVGKNLADISKIAIGKSWSGSAYSQRATILWIPIEANQKYNLVSSWTNPNITNIRVVLGHGASDPTNNYIPNSFPFTNTTWEYASIEVLANTAFTSDMLDGVKIMLCKGEDSDYEPYIEQVNEINLGKNLLDTSGMSTGTNYGITKTRNSDGSITLSGTASQDYYIFLFSTQPKLKAGTYTLSGCTGGSSSTYRLAIMDSSYSTNLAVNYDGGTSFTLNSDTIISPLILVKSGVNINKTFYPMIEVGSQATSYSEYFTPIELCKIGTYEDKIFKTTGKNLFDKDNSTILNAYFGTDTLTSDAGNKTTYIKCSPNTTYTISKTASKRFAVAYTKVVPAINTTIYGRVNGYDLSSITITTGSDALYLVVWLINSNLTGEITLDEAKNTLQIEKGTTATTYEPYSNNEWYVKKAIGKKILNGSENWGTIGDNRYWVAFSDKRGLTSQVPCLLMSNYFKAVQYAGGAVGIGEMTEGYYTIANYNVFFNYNGSNNDLAGFKTWLSTHNTIVYYILGTPTYEKLNDTLQEELNSIRLLEGLNNIMSSVPIDLTYVSGIDTIDEEYFNEDNVNFGEIYGPVNTIILSRSAESDEIAKSIPSNLSDDEKVAIKISDNQIMNFDNRDEFLYGILTRLYGLRYVQNDYSSKGICYYDLCDRYRADIFGKSYYCVMLNDDVTIESGLSENVFTEIPDTAKTEYSNTTTTDRLERKTTLIVDKQVGEIRAEISTIDDQLNGANGVTSKLNAQGQTLDIWSKSFDENGNVIALNTTNYTFDNEGLKIGKSTDDYNSLQDNTGTYYYEKDTMTGKYTKEGSVQKDMALFGRYYYGIDEENFDVSTFSLKDANFVAQWYDNGTEEGFGHFWNGE